VVRLLEHPLPVAVGVASYSLFLWHFPIIYWLQAHHALLAGWAGLPANIAITAVVAGTLSALTYRFVERPALKRKRPTRDRETEPAAAAPPAAAVEAALT
jgi:peptidoglycan/LPS O-acetylase OafA/YrhL